MDSPVTIASSSEERPLAPISIVGSEVFYGTFHNQKLGLIKALRLAQPCEAPY